MLCYRVQPPRADAVHAVFVFLDLLEGYADGIPQLFLRHAVNKPRGPYLKADMNVYRANPATDHCVNSLKDCSHIKTNAHYCNF